MSAAQAMKQRAVNPVWGFIRALASRMAHDRVTEMAAALAYRTIFSLIPVLVIALVLLRAFFGDEGIRLGFSKLMEYSGLQQIALGAEGEAGLSVPVPPTESGGAESAGGEGVPMDDATAQALSAWIEQFVNNAVSQISGLNYGAITLVGAGLLIYSAISLVISVEQAFNAVCRAASGRRLGVRLTTYWTLLTLGSIALIGSFTLTEWYARTLSTLPGWATWATRPAHFMATVGITWLILLLAYSRMPNARVRLRFAAGGAFVAATMWELLKNGLTIFIGTMTQGQVAVYGSLALIPLFVMWVYVTWLIVLFGLEFSCTLQSAGPRWRGVRVVPVGTRLFDPSVAVLLLKFVAREFAAGRQPGVQDIAAACRLPEDLAHMLLERLVLAELLVKTQTQADEAGFTLPRPPEAIRLAEVIACAQHEAEPSYEDEPGLLAMRDQQAAALGDRTLASVL